MQNITVLENSQNSRAPFPIESFLKVSEVFPETIYPFATLFVSTSKKKKKRVLCSNGSYWVSFVAGDLKTRLSVKDLLHKNRSGVFAVSVNPLLMLPKLWYETVGETKASPQVFQSKWWRKSRERRPNWSRGRIRSWALCLL